MIVLEVLFWFSVASVLYVLIGYPAMMYLLARIRPRPIRKDSSYTPRVCFVMAAYNEEKLIGEKLRNYSELDYPRENLRFLIGSDGSSDATDQIVAEWAERDPSIVLSRYNRVGKTRIVFDLADRATEEILVFTDADVILEPGALRKIVECFADPTVGGVISTMIYTDDARNAGNVGQQRYQKMEDWLRYSEGLHWTTFGPRGECFGVRRGAYKPLADLSLAEDVHLVISIPVEGRRVWYEPGVVVYETTRRSVATEYRRRLRLGHLMTATVFAHPETRLPWRSFLGFQVWSHKILRNLLALPIALAILCSLVLGPLVGGVYTVAAVGSVALLVVLLLGAVCDRFGWSLRPVQYPLYFSAMFASLALGTMRAFGRKGMPTWTQSRVEGS